MVAFRRRALFPLDDCPYALQPTVPHLTRSFLHRCLKRHGISAAAGRRRSLRQAQIQGDLFHIDIAEVRTAQANSTCLSP